MESLNKNNDREHISKEDAPRGVNYWKWTAVGFIGIFVFTQLFDVSIKPHFNFGRSQNAGTSQNRDFSNLQKVVLPANGMTLPVKWNNLGKLMVETGVIDKDKFESIYTQRVGLGKVEESLLYGDRNGRLKITKENSGFLLNLLWAFGLSNKNPILENGPMTTISGDASRFASTGGWSLSKGNVMKHYSKHTFVTLTKEQQKLVEKVSKNIYRPCCGNSAYFPDCNHGMAMLGLLELMASQGASEEEMYKAALKANSYWFPDTYITIAKYFKDRGVKWSEINPKEVLGSLYSGAQGYRRILEEVNPPQSNGKGGSCGV